ncbi:hypothetical protein Poly30_40970 [Planctomycetes bacterium Poly30]|uniref:Uncharacterized protein n=1 Tax=Saltatorellus ferox TaxID=2528018 RepID=A0A518EWS8_9BACT|nr:hypothetical protein Poly30_40970 [Planctomycetes bacterium Poly30]
MGLSVVRATPLVDQTADQTGAPEHVDSLWLQATGWGKATGAASMPGRVNFFVTFANLPPIPLGTVDRLPYESACLQVPVPVGVPHGFAAAFHAELCAPPYTGSPNVIAKSWFCEMYL